jgi:hypothetical protein
LARHGWGKEDEPQIFLSTQLQFQSRPMDESNNSIYEMLDEPEVIKDERLLDTNFVPTTSASANLLRNSKCFGKIMLYLKEIDRVHLQILSRHFYDCLIPEIVRKCSILSRLFYSGNSNILPPIFQRKRFLETPFDDEWNISENDILDL